MSDRKTASFVNEAMGMVSNGLSVLPVKTDKKPTVPTWKRWQAERMTPAEVREHFTRGTQTALIGGAVSGNLECLDFDRPDLYQPFLDTLESINPDLRQRLTLRQKTPSGGYHLIYRCVAPVGGSVKLARSAKYTDAQGHPRQDVFIETRGEAGYFLVAPSSATPHGGGPAIQYQLVGSFDSVPTISSEERDFLHSLAHSFDEGAEARHPEERTGATGTDGDRPGDRFNREMDWHMLLTGYGWTPGGTVGDRQHWTRPGKTDGSISATLHPERGLYVFSTSTPLPTEKPLSQFSVFAYYAHGGDFQEAARELTRRYVDRPATTRSTATTGEDRQEGAEELETTSWPALAPAALYGFAGDFVELACRNSEADPAAVLATFIVRFGVEVGSGPALHTGDSRQSCRLASVIVGSSSKARKGTSGKPVARLFAGIDGAANSSPGPFSSGEGIIWAVRDAVQQWKDAQQCMVTVDPGVTDKRLFVLDEEFGGVLANTKREGNTLSMVIRCAWDDGRFDPLTKTNKIRATKAHVGWVSHITTEELHRKLDDSEGFNGFANRILWVCARRQKLVPFPSPMPEDELAALQVRLSAVLTPLRGKDHLQLLWSQEARQVWEDQYPRLTADHRGLVGCVINRGEAQVVRLAMLYCLLDGSTVIEESHLTAAMAWWSYCEQSARYIFHGRQEDIVSQRILEALRDRGEMTGKDIHALFANNLPKERLERALNTLIAGGVVAQEQERLKGKGRPAIKYRFQQTPYEKNERNELNPPDQDKTAINSLNSFNSLRSNEKSEVVEVEI